MAIFNNYVKLPEGIYWLVVWSMAFIFRIGNKKTTNWLICVRGVDTTNQYRYGYIIYIYIFIDMRKREGRHVTSRSYVYVARNHAAGSQAMCPAGPARNLSMRNGHPSCCQPHCVTHSASNRVKLWWLEGAVGAKQRWATHPISIPSALRVVVPMLCLSI